MSKLNLPHGAGRVRTSRATFSHAWWREAFGIHSSSLPAFAWPSSVVGGHDAHN